MVGPVKVLSLRFFCIYLSFVALVPATRATSNATFATVDQTDIRGLDTA